MGKYIVLLFAIFVLNFVNGQSVDRCATMDVLKEQLKNAPKGTHYYKNFLEANEVIENGNFSNFRTFNDTIVIPVVVHVVYKTANQNIANAKIIQQMIILNRDFARLNADTGNTPDAFKTVAGGLKIKFVLASVDPDGNPTTGVERVQTTVNSFSTNNDVKFTSKGGADAWPADKYLNLWSANFGGGLLGYAQFPGGDPATDGVAILFKSFGVTTNVPYHLGRTATHEVGHWLGLRHINGDGFCGDDFVNDTPPQEGLTSGCPDYPELQSCSPIAPGIQFMNYMDYTDDSCYNMFSRGQVERMEFFLLTDRNTFLDSSELSYTDANLTELTYLSDDNCSGDYNPTILIKNDGFSKISSMEIKSFIDGLYENIETINEEIEIGASKEISLSPFSLTEGGNFELKIDILKVNESEDRFLTNNKILKGINFIKEGKLTPIEEAFEDVEPIESKGFTIENPDGEDTWELADFVGFSSDQSFFMDNFSYQAEGELDNLILPALDLSNLDSAYMNFDYAYQVYESTSLGRRADGLSIEVSLDCGVNWIEIWNKAGDDLASVPGETTSEFEPIDDSEWAQNQIDLSSYVGNNLILVKFVGLNDYGNNLYVDNINVVGIINTGINAEIIESNSIKLFPNPSNKQTNLIFNAKVAGMLNLELSDITGRVIMSKTIDAEKGINNQSIDLSGKSAGTYFVTLSDNGFKQTLKLIVY